MYHYNCGKKKKCSPQKRTALYLAKPFGWLASKRFRVRLPHDFTLTLGHCKVEDTDLEVDKS
jgi:hypothetical protein